MTTGEIVAILAVAVMIGAAAILAAAETAITRISSARAEALVEEGRRGAKVLRSLVAERDRVLAPLLFVVLGCQLGAATIVAVLVDRRWGTEALIGAFAAELLLLFVFAEALPKSWSLAHPDRSAVLVAPVARVVASIAPLRWLSNGVNHLFGSTPRDEDPSGGVAEEELLALAEEAAASDAIDEDERHLIGRIIEFGDTLANEVMVPRPDMVVVPAECTIGAAIEIAILNGFSRVPVCGDDGVDDIVGIVHAKDLMRAARDERVDEPVSAVMREPRFVPETKRIAQLLREMQAETAHMAIVVDEYGGTAGLVTLEDLIEEVVGEIVDEFDVEPPMIEQIDESHLRVNGRVSLWDLGDLVGRELPEGEWSSVGGLIFTTLGRVPDVGDVCEVEGHRFLVERVQGRRIARVLVTLAAPVPADDEELEEVR